MTEAEKKLRNLRQLVRDDCRRIWMAERALDAQMNLPSTYERGRVIAQILNEITIARQSMQHFGLGIPLEKCK